MKNRRSREEMESLLERRKAEGLTYKALVEESGIPMHTLQYWASKFRKEEVAQNFQSETALVPVEVIDESKSTTLQLELTSGIKVNVSPEFSSEHLLRLVRLLSAAC